jgi:hypothetical protein
MTAFANEEDHPRDVLSEMQLKKLLSMISNDYGEEHAMATAMLITQMPKAFARILAELCISMRLAAMETGDGGVEFPPIKIIRLLGNSGKAISLFLTLEDTPTEGLTEMLKEAWSKGMVRQDEESLN